MENTQTQIDYPRGLTFEQVWAALMETRQRQEEYAKRHEEEYAKQQEEYAKRQEEYAKRQEEYNKRQEEYAQRQAETDRQIREIGKRFGDFTNRFGEVVEYMIAPNLQDKFYDMGFDFHTVSSNFKANDHKNDIHFQVDVFLQNGDTAMLVEIKTKLTISDINDHIKRMEKMRVFADLRGDKRHFLGAVAGVIIESEEREYALNNGFFIIEPAGETFNITPPYNKPKEW